MNKNLKGHNFFLRVYTKQNWLKEHSVHQYENQRIPVFMRTSAQKMEALHLPSSFSISIPLCLGGGQHFNIFRPKSLDKQKRSVHLKCFKTCHLMHFPQSNTTPKLPNDFG